MTKKYNDSLLEKMRVTRESMSGALTNYFKNAVTVENIEIENESLGSMYNVYTLSLGYRFDDNGNDVKPIKLIAKCYKNLNGNFSQSNWNRQRRDSLTYEKAISMAVENAPRYVYSNRNLLVMEYLGEDTLESMFLNQDKRNMLIQSGFLESLVVNVARYHERLIDIAVNEFSKLSKTDYAARFREYVDEIWEWKNKKGSLSDEYKKKLNESFAPLAEILEKGTVNGGYLSRTALHHDLHPGHIFYKDDDILRPYFIDPKPRKGPVQFDLVDFLTHPVIEPFIGLNDQRLEELLKLYMTQRFRIAGVRRGIKMNGDVELTKQSIDDCMAMTLVAGFFRDIRGASKSCGMENDDPDILKQYLKVNSLFDLYKFRYLSAGVEKLNKIISLDQKYFRFPNEELKNLDDLTKLLEYNFKDEIKRGDEVKQRLSLVSA